jgi:hypothetical protein
MSPNVLRILQKLELKLHDQNLSFYDMLNDFFLACSRISSFFQVYFQAFMTYLPTSKYLFKSYYSNMGRYYPFLHN